MTAEQATGDPENRPVSMAVVEEVAAAEDVSALELDSLYTVVDTDALDALFSGTSTGFDRNGTVEFRYEGWLVSIDGSGEIEVTEPDDDEGSASS